MTDDTEILPGRVLRLLVGQTKTFKTASTINRGSTGDPGIAALTTATEQATLTGRFPGTTMLMLYDNSGSVSYNEVRVETELTRHSSSGRNAVKFIPVGDSGRLILTGEVDSPEQLIRLFTTGNTGADDRGMNIDAANNRLLNKRIGEQGASSR